MLRLTLTTDSVFGPQDVDNDITDELHEKKKNPSVANTIRSISYNQHEILYNIMQMHNDGKTFDCDPTYSIGNFYGTFQITDINGISKTIEIPAPRLKFDVAPMVEGVTQIEPLGAFPLDDKSIGSICIDLPFVISCGPSMEGPNYDENGKRVNNNIISRRFAAYYPVAELLKSYKHFITESYRVLQPNGILVFKCQNTITGSKFLASPYYTRLIAESVGFDTLDEFVLLAKNRLISGKINKQQHARSFHSYFLVFKKSLSKKVRYFDFMPDNEVDGLLQGLVQNNRKKGK